MLSNSLPRNHVVHFDSDAEVKTILVELGVIERLAFPSDVSGNVLHYAISEHPTHWLLFTKFRDFPNPKDNGYAAVGYPKLSVSEQQANKLAHELITKRGFTATQNQQIFSGAPKPVS